jgi:hypothetical protein
MRARILIYIDPADLESLRVEARSRGISVAVLMCRLIREHTRGREIMPKPSRETNLAIVSLGSSGKSDISDNHDAYIAEALRREHSG